MATGAGARCGGLRRQDGGVVRHPRRDAAGAGRAAGSRPAGCAGKPVEVRCERRTPGDRARGGSGGAGAALRPHTGVRRAARGAVEVVEGAAPRSGRTVPVAGLLRTVREVRRVHARRRRPAGTAARAGRTAGGGCAGALAGASRSRGRGSRARAGAGAAPCAGRTSRSRSSPWPASRPGPRPPGRRAARPGRARGPRRTTARVRRASGCCRSARRRGARPTRPSHSSAYA
ncbi:hypothetical protein F750_4646 [Streptomyces sp. PAMC 26508]|nr:hypothetical protein F750_4646 [Streptomyces sp. PAMC 26508]